MDPVLTTRVTTLVVARRADDVLLMHRRTPPNAGLWSPPGGKLRPPETPLQCAAREFAEETGLEARDLSLAAVVTEVDRRAREAWVMFVYRARATGEPVAEHREGRNAWVPVTELERLPRPPADHAIVGAALAAPGITYIRVEMDGDRLVLLETATETRRGG